MFQYDFFSKFKVLVLPFKFPSRLGVKAHPFGSPSLSIVYDHSSGLNNRRLSQKGLAANTRRIS